MTKAKNGDTVKVFYTGRLDDGTVFDSNKDRDALQFEVGGGQVIPGFDETVNGMETGETQTVRIPPEQAYGEYREDLKLEVPRAQFPTDVEPAVGQQYRIDQESGQAIMAHICDLSEEAIILDANHPLAGKALTFEIQLSEIV